MPRSLPSLVHLTREPSRRGGAPPPLLVLLHGIGSNERDLIAMAPYLDGRFFIASVRAPFELGPEMYGWFRVDYTPTGVVADLEEAERSRQALVGFIDEAVARYGLNPDRVYLMGFSQGAIISLAAAVTRPEKLAGVVAMSGRFLPEFLVRSADPAFLQGLPMLVVHGTFDPVLPIENGRGIRDQLSRLPVTLTYLEYDMGHEVTYESLRDVAHWLASRLDE